MRAFTIDANDNITAYGSTEELGELMEGTQRFENEEDLARLAAGWPGNRLVEIWNGLAGVQPVQKFTSRKTGATRIWKAIQGLGQGDVKQSATARPQKPKKAAAGRSSHGARTTSLPTAEFEEPKPGARGPAMKPGTFMIIVSARHSE